MVGLTPVTRCGLLVVLRSHWALKNARLAYGDLTGLLLPGTVSTAERGLVWNVETPANIMNLAAGFFFFHFDK